MLKYYIVWVKWIGDLKYIDIVKKVNKEINILEKGG